MPLWYGLAFIVNKNGKTRFASRGKWITESQFYNKLDLEAKNKKKTKRRYKSKKMVWNQE